MDKKAYFVSDLHLGADYQNAIPDREVHFCDFLQQIAYQASHLIILGDLFEFWMEYSYYIPKNYFKVLAALHDLSKRGVIIHYLSGNHDFNLGHFFKKTLNIHTHHHPLEINIQGKALYLFHGDGAAKSDWKYRLVKKILVHPFSNWCFKQIHPDWGMRLAKLAGKKSRIHPGSSLQQEYQKQSLQFLKNGADIVMHGHTHSAFIKNTKEGIYINTGDWLEKMRYVEMEKGSCTIKTYAPIS